MPDVCKVEVLHSIQHDGVLYEGGKVYSLDPKTAEIFASLRDAVSKEPIACLLKPEAPMKAQDTPQSSPGPDAGRKASRAK